LPLPIPPDRYQSEAYQQIVRSLPGKWFHQLESGTSPLYPLLQGLARSLAYARIAYERALEASIVKTAGGPWLSLHMQGIGLQRRSGETDIQARTRYEWEFKPTRNTRAGQLAALSHYLGLAPPEVKLEGDRALNRLGEFRIVINSSTKTWTEVDFGFVGEFIRRYVTNGVVPSLQINLANPQSGGLTLFNLKPWRFSDQFPMSWNVMGPLWERRAFINGLRLRFAHVLIVQLSDADWRANRDRLATAYQQTLGDAPGARFYYLSAVGSAPYLLADYALQLSSTDINQTFPRQPFRADGWRFSTQFLATQSLAPEALFLAPAFTELPPAPLVPIYTPAVNIAPLDISVTGSNQNADLAYLRYKGISFTQFRVKRFLPAEPPNTDPGYTSPELIAMQSGPWTLALTEGSSAWGNSPPQGSTLTGTPFADLKPSAIWWTDAEGVARSPIPIWSGQAIYLGIEFLLPKGSDRTIREVELRLQGSRVNYRRVSAPIDSELNCGFLFKVRGI
jgi:hypothetical protein